MELQWSGALARRNAFLIVRLFIRCQGLVKKLLFWTSLKDAYVETVQVILKVLQVTFSQTRFILKKFNLWGYNRLIIYGSHAIKWVVATAFGDWMACPLNYANMTIFFYLCCFTLKPVEEVTYSLSPMWVHLWVSIRRLPDLIQGLMIIAIEIKLLGVNRSQGITLIASIVAYQDSMFSNCWLSLLRIIWNSCQISLYHHLRWILHFYQYIMFLFSLFF